MIKGNDVPTLIIPTAGLGSRLGAIAKKINKALLPYKNKPVLSHIIDSFPKETKIIIPIGYKSQQIIDYCNLVYSDRTITFVEVDDYLSEKSGPAYTLKLCKNFVEGPFWYITCDTYFNENIFEKYNDLTEDCFFVKQVSVNESILYTMFKLDNNSKIKQIKFKENVDNDWLAFTGVMYIHDHTTWWNDLLKLESNEFIHNIKLGKNTNFLNSWKDFGCLKIYEDVLKNDNTFDFSKPNELTFICNGKVCKWWLDAKIPKLKVSKIQSKLDQFPNNVKNIGNFLVYDYFEGETLYQNCDKEIFLNLINWLDCKFWNQENIDIRESCFDFYCNKTEDRVSKFLKHNNVKQDNFYINNAFISSSQYVKLVNWQLLTNTFVASYIHGDLQFDNIIQKNNEFKLIDWRQSFADLTYQGDLYYDFAKLLACFYVDFSKVKNNYFNIIETENKVLLEIPHIENFYWYKQTLEQYVNNKGYNWQKVEMLVPLIYLNMAPLHNSPFDKFLWYLGIKILNEYKLGIKL